MGLPFSYEDLVDNPKLGHAILDQLYELSKSGASAGSAPTGSLLDKASAIAPPDYLLCDGAAVSRSTYAALFADIGTVWGVGDGSTTFNLPDFRGIFRVGAGGSYALADSGGQNTHALTSSEMPAHTHTTPNHAHTIGSSKYTVNASHTHGGVGGGVAENSNPTDGDSSPLPTTNTDGASATGSTGSGTAHENRPPYRAVYTFIHI
jgi:microcystin-dependent protein